LAVCVPEGLAKFTGKVSDVVGAVGVRGFLVGVGGGGVGVGEDPGRGSGVGGTVACILGRVVGCTVA
jgi:hypothetical protein